MAGAFGERLEQGVIGEIEIRTPSVLGLQDAPLYDLGYMYPRVTASVNYELNVDCN